MNNILCDWASFPLAFAASFRFFFFFFFSRFPLRRDGGGGSGRLNHKFSGLEIEIRGFSLQNMAVITKKGKEKAATTSPLTLLSSRADSPI